MPDLTVAQTATRLQMTVRTVRNLIERGRFPGAYRMDPQSRSVYRIPERDVIQFERQRSQQPASPQGDK